MKERKYRAYGDTGRDYIEWEFYSEYRANSKGNIIDAERTYKKKHGHVVKVLKTEKITE